jgi:hypothetical protein
MNGKVSKQIANVLQLNVQVDELHLLWKQSKEKNTIPVVNEKESNVQLEMSTIK